jgi:hypothetical protein
MLKTAEESTPCALSTKTKPDSRGTSPGMAVVFFLIIPGRPRRHNPICRLARSFMISSVPPPMALTLTSR